jgi:hypothetical protein
MEDRELRHVPRGLFSATFGGSWRVFNDESLQIASQLLQIHEFYLWISKIHTWILKNNGHWVAAVICFSFFLPF